MKILLVEDDIDSPTTKELANRDKHMVGKMHRTIKKVTDLIEEFKLSLAIGVLMDYTNKLYKYRDGQINKEVYDNAVKAIIQLLSPFAPHVCEEMWEMIGEKEMLSKSSWPEFDKTMIDEEAEAAEEMVSQTISDIASVLKLTNKESAKKVTLFVADTWKYNFMSTLKTILEETRNPGEILGKIMATDLKKQGQQISKMVPKYVKDPSKIPATVLTLEKEYAALVEAKEAIESEFKCEVNIVKELESKEAKARQSMPSKPAILVE